jgi:hypothetical protein
VYGAGTSDNQIQIYNNVFYYTDLSKGTASPGIITILAPSAYPKKTANNIHIYNNTFYNIGSATYTGIKAQIWNYAADGNYNNIEVKNNLWVKSNFTTGHYHITSLSNNDYYNNTGAGVPKGETNQQTESADPFVDSAGYDFQLNYTAKAKDNGIDLSSIFSTDILGNRRGVHNRPWDIGAYEYNEPVPPVNLKTKSNL